jgi:hypothetical protein
MITIASGGAPIHSSSGSAVSNAVIFGFLGALAGAVAGGPAGGARRIIVVETIRWSTTRALSFGLGGLASGTAIGAVMAVALTLPYRLPAAIDIARAVLVVAPLTGVCAGVLGGISSGEVETRVTPNEGIWRSARMAILVGLAIVLVIVLSVGLTAGFLGLSYVLLAWVAVGLIGALAVGVPAAMAFGGYACVSHMALRVVMWRAGLLPLNTIRFLDFATERILLRRVGGGYIFVHRLLQEYFASLEPEQRSR